MWSWPVLKVARRGKGSGEPAAPKVCDSLEPLRSVDNEWAIPVNLRARKKPIPQPVGDDPKHLLAVFLRPDQYLIALQLLHVKERGIRDPMTRVEHQPDDVLHILARPLALAPFALPGRTDVITFFDREGTLYVYGARRLIARRDNPRNFVIAERQLVRRFARPNGRLDIRADRRLGNPLATLTEIEEPL
jgi:hypothetical protein